MDSKDGIRKRMLARRASVTEKEAERGSLEVLKNLFGNEKFLSAESVGFYYPLRGELDVKPAIERSFRLGKTVCLPRVFPERIEFYAVDSMDDLGEGPMGIPEPPQGEIAAPGLLVVPGLAFDLRKYRLGFGKGYYDKYLAAHDCFAIGVCFEWQVEDRLPATKSDIRMDEVISEGWIIE